MPKSPEKYEPKPEEIKEDEEMMTDVEKELSQTRSGAYEAGAREAKKSWIEKVWQIDIRPTGDTEDESGINEIFDSKNELEPLRCLMYRESDGDLLFHFSSKDNGDENQKFELVINDKTYSLVTLRPSPDGDFFAKARIGRDELKESTQNMSKLIFRLRRCE